MEDLEKAAMHFKKRNYFLYRAFNKYIAFNDVQAIAFIRFSPMFPNGYDIIYVGTERDLFKRWIQPLMAETVETTMLNITNTSETAFLPPQQIHSFDEGIILQWTAEQPKNPLLIQLLYEGLKAISYVELKEYDYFYELGTPFDDEVARAIQKKDQDGLIELLSLTKLMTNSDITFWGETTSREVEVDMHLGSKNNDFGFLLPVGEGIGGLAAQENVVLQVDDYQNCPYRYKDVSMTVDEEKIRTVFALPLKDQEKNTSGILYVANRTINPLPLEKKFLLLRLGHQLEPIVRRTDIRQFSTPSERASFFHRKKDELRHISQHARTFKEVNTWLASLLKGKVTFIQEGQTKNNEPSEPDYTFAVTRTDRNLGTLYIWTDIKLPLETEWPDLIEDVIHTLFIIDERNERFYHLADLERSQWLHNMLHAPTDRDALYKQGVKLHVPVDQGEVWAFFINKKGDFLSLEEKMKLESVALHHMREPIYFSGTSGYIVFDRSIDCTPEQLRNDMLALLPKEMWLIHQATYTTFSELQTVLARLQTLLKTTTEQQMNTYVLTFEHFGLDHLLSNPRIAEDLQSFASNLLKDIIAYDEEHDSELTKTLALSLVYQSPSKVAKKLFIHPNTVHYRVNRAKQLLNNQTEDPRFEIALAFAAYTWLFKQNITIPSTTET